MSSVEKFDAPSGNLARAVEVINRGGVVAVPTDTVYCLAASIKYPDAVGRIFDIKGRQTTKALPVLVADAIQMRQVAEMTPLADLLVRRFMPGGLTMILKKKASVPDIVTGDKDTVAVRIPGHTLPLYLIKACASPLTGTSANLSGHGSVRNASEVEAQIGHLVDFIFDGGECPGGVESTIIDLTIDPPVIVREGAVERSELENFYSR